MIAASASTILVITDLSPQAYGALRVAHTLATDSGGKLKVLHIVDMMGDDNPLHVFFDSADELESRVQREGYVALEEHVVKVLGDDHGAQLEIKFGHPVNDCIRAAHFDDTVSIVVAGSTGHGRLFNAVFGSTVGRIIRECDKPVLVVPPDTEDYRVVDILAPVDMSDCSRRSLVAAVALAKAAKGRVFAFSALHIPPVTPYFPAMPVTSVGLLEPRAKVREEALQAWVEELDAGEWVEVLPVENVENVSMAILEAAERIESGLICLGTHGRSGLERAVMGSVTERVLRQSKTPILVMR